jgi:hypothetical protein
MTATTALNKWKGSFSRQQAAVAGLLLLGALLRVRQYLTGRSLWADEAMLALNIVNRGFAGMFKPLDYDQGAPIGFLLVEKSVNFLLGKNELVLRLVPLLAGLLSLWLFYLLLKRLTTGAGLLAALALFALNPRLVYYSSEVKQYIMDVVVTISLLLIAAPLFRTAPRKRDFVWLALAGLAAMWFSHPALFVVGGIGLALLILYLRRREYASLRFLLGVGLIWTLNIGLLYFLILKDLNQNAYMREYWQGAFLPVPPWSDPAWFLQSIRANISTQFGMPYAALFVFVLMLAGWVALWREKSDYALTLLCVLLVTLAASALQLYPLLERMVLFLVPLGLILLGKVVESLYQGLQKYPLPRVLATALLCGCLIYAPLVTSVQAFLRPKYFEHIRPTMEYLRGGWKKGDALYVSQGAVPAFRFYAPFYGLESIPYEYGKREDDRDPQALLTEIEAFRGQPRVWILFSHVYEKGDFNEKDFLLNDLNQMGEKKREFRLPGTSVFLYLYDLEK